MTGLYPWLGYQLTDSVLVWDVTGYGSGGLLLTPGEGAPLESALSMAMAAGGTRGGADRRRRGRLRPGVQGRRAVGRPRIDGVDGPAGRLAATEAAVNRFRTGLEGSCDYRLGDDR